MSLDHRPDACADTPEKLRFSADCQCRVLFEELADKWSMMILSVLASGPTRFNEIKRRLEGVSQKSLTQTLRKLERNGMIRRAVHPGPPLAVDYALEPLGESVLEPFKALYQWTHRNQQAVDAARAAYDARQT